MHALILLLALTSPGDSAPIAPPVLVAQESAMHEHADDPHEHDDYGEAPRQESYLVWLLKALGIRYVLLFVLTGPLVFLGALIVVALCKRPGPIAAFFPFVAIPMLIGVFGFFDGAVNVLMALGSSPIAPKPAEMAYGLSTALVTPMVGLFLSAPSYLILAIGLFVRSLLYREPTKT
jgi:hypothetical protein